MADVTEILELIDRGDPQAAEKLLPLVYDERRKLAAQRLAREKPGQTLQATDLLHEAYLRLVGADAPQHWNSRGHFFGAAAEAMRRILVGTYQRGQVHLVPRDGRLGMHGSCGRTGSPDNHTTPARTRPQAEVPAGVLLPKTIWTTAHAVHFHVPAN